MYNLLQYTRLCKGRIWSIWELQCHLFHNIPDHANEEYGVSRSSNVLSITTCLVMQRENMKFPGAPMSSLSQYTGSCKGRIWSVQELQYTLYYNIPDYAKGQYGECGSSNVLSITIYLIMSIKNEKCVGAPISSLSQHIWLCKGRIWNILELECPLFHKIPYHAKGEYGVFRSSNVLSFTIYLVMQNENMECPGAQM